MSAGKGFLGPIGDDLPSLIPLVFALTIFFYVFTFAWNVFDEKNQTFDDAITVLRIATILKGNSYLTGYEDFVQKCNEAKSFKRIKFKAGLIPLAVERNQHFPGLDLENPEFFKDPFNGNVFECTNTSEEFTLKAKVVGIRFFPVALERDYRDNEGKKHFFIKPMLLVVFAWR